MGDKNPKKQKKKKQVVEKNITEPLAVEQNVEKEQKGRQKNQSKGR